ncbi:MAG: M14 family zinc carboxypeptidase [Clostridia bacterium]|nr:M14 family zinc carboxypeptidase [Clostridia bacterium]
MQSYKDYLDCCYQCGAFLATVGYTVKGREIKMLTKGIGEAKTLIVGGVHAREHITCDLLLALTAAYEGRNAIDVIPALNLDGILLTKLGLNGIPLTLRERNLLLAANNGDTDFSLWKANIRAVDINNNFDAGWGEGKGNVFAPAPHGYVGTHPHSEPETVAAVKLMDSRKYSLVIAYHSKGEEVYWGFRNKKPYKKEATRIADALGYPLKETPESAGGLKDYWIQKTGRLGLTVEVGEDRFPHPYPVSELPNLVARHKDIFRLSGEIATELWNKDL